MVVNCYASTLRFFGTNGQDAIIPWKPTRVQETTKRIAENGGIGSHAARRSSREVDNAVEVCVFNEGTSEETDHGKMGPDDDSHPSRSPTLEQKMGIIYLEYNPNPT